MELTPQTFGELADWIHRLCGLVVGPDKMYLVRHRLGPVVRRFELNGFEGLLQRLQMREQPRLHDAIIEAITTKETSFFRDHAFFQALSQHVLPECVARLKSSGGKRHRIRLWSAGASTGQEAYSLAMLVRDLIESNLSQGLHEGQFTILASDISAEALEKAQAGRYSRSEVARGLSEGVLGRHFKLHGDRWAVTDPLQRMIQFRRLNLLHPPADLGAFDVILCRNVLIYFDEPTRRKVCQTLYSTLHDGGWLALGSAESLYGIEDRMQDVKVGKVMLYRKPQHDEGMRREK